MGYETAFAETKCDVRTSLTCAQQYGQVLYPTWYPGYCGVSRLDSQCRRVGPAGYGPQNFVRADSLLPYTIHFENETNATAPAQQVVSSDRLTNLLDWTTFELTEIAFGDQFIAVPPQHAAL